MPNTETAQQKFFRELRESAADSEKLGAQLLQLTEETNHRIGYSHSLSQLGDRLVTHLDHKVPSIQVRVVDKASGRPISFTVPAESLAAVSSQTEEQAFMILTSSVVDTAVRIVDKSGYKYDEHKPDNDKRAIGKVLRLFETFPVEENHHRLIQRDQILLALLGSGYLTGREVHFADDGWFTVDTQYLGENYLDKTAIYTLAHGLYSQRYYLPESVISAFNDFERLNLFFNDNTYKSTKTITQEFPHTGYDALISYHLRTVLLGQQPDIVIAGDWNIDDFNDYLGG